MGGDQIQEIDFAVKYDFPGIGILNQAFINAGFYLFYVKSGT